MGRPFSLGDFVRDETEAQDYLNADANRLSINEPGPVQKIVAKALIDNNVASQEYRVLLGLNSTSNYVWATDGLELIQEKINIVSRDHRCAFMTSENNLREVNENKTTFN